MSPGYPNLTAGPADPGLPPAFLRARMLVVHLRLRRDRQRRARLAHNHQAARRHRLRERGHRADHRLHLLDRLPHGGPRRPRAALSTPVICTGSGTPAAASRDSDRSRLTVRGPRSAPRVVAGAAQAPGHPGRTARSAAAARRITSRPPAPAAAAMSAPTPRHRFYRIDSGTARGIAGRVGGPILLNSPGARMDRHAATRHLRQPPRRGRGRPAPARATTACQSIADARR